MSGKNGRPRTTIILGLLLVASLSISSCSPADTAYTKIEVGPLTMEYPAEYTARPVPAEEGSWTSSTGLSYDKTSTSMTNDEQTILYTVDFYEGVSFEYAFDRAANGLQGTQGEGIDEDEFAEKWHTNVFEAVSDVSVQEPVMTEIDGHRAFSREITWKLNGTSALRIARCIEVDEDGIAVVTATFASGEGAKDDVAKFERMCSSIEVES